MSSFAYEDLSILVVDDFESFRLTVCNMLQEFGCEQVATEINGRRAIRLCEEKTFDVIICDYNLGSGPTGQQVLESLRSRDLLKRQTLFLLISAETSKSIVLSAYDYEPDAYLTKPITGKGLKQRLDRLLRQRHELLSIYQALDDNDRDRAIELLQQLLIKGSRYSGTCQKLLGDLYVETGQLQKAKALYQTAIDLRPLDWARAGLAQVLALEGDHKGSIAQLHELIEESPFCMKAYDLLADNHRRSGDPDKVQQVLQTAVDISPMAILRQMELAETAYNNRDFTAASRAYGRAVRLGENSCHDNIQNHLQYARTTAAELVDSPSPSSDAARDALQVLEQLDKHFESAAGRRDEAKLLEVQLLVCRGEQRKARELFQKLEAQMQDMPLDLDTQLDRVATYVSLGETDRSKALIQQLLQEYDGDEEALQRIDLWLEEPASKKNIKMVARINNQGITLYKQKNFKEALEYFTKAARLFPNHIGVRLNLIQVLVADMKEYGIETGKMDACLTALHNVEKRLKAGHPQLQRFRQLQQGLRALG